MYSVPSVSANATIPYPYIPTESLSTSHGAIGEGCYQLVSDGAERVVVQSGVGGYRSPQKSRNPMNWCGWSLDGPNLGPDGGSTVGDGYH